MSDTGKIIFLPQLQRYDQKIKEWADNKFLTEADTPLLPVATATTLGGVKVGNGLSVTDDGMLSKFTGVEYYSISNNTLYKDMSKSSVKQMYDDWKHGYNIVLSYESTKAFSLSFDYVSDTKIWVTAYFISGITTKTASNVTNGWFGINSSMLQNNNGDVTDAAEWVVSTSTLGQSIWGSNSIIISSPSGLEVKDGGIASTKLADGAVTTAKIADGAITKAKLASDIADGANTKAKLASDVGASDMKYTQLTRFSSNNPRRTSEPIIGNNVFYIDDFPGDANTNGVIAYTLIDYQDFIGVVFKHIFITAKVSSISIRFVDTKGKDTIYESWEDSGLIAPFPNVTSTMPSYIVSAWSSTGAMQANDKQPVYWVPKSTSAQAALASLLPVQDECEEMEAEVTKLEQDWIDNLDETVTVDGNGVPITIATKKTELEKKKAELEKLREDYFSKLGDWKNEVQE